MDIRNSVAQIRMLPGKAGILAAYEETLGAGELRIKCMATGYRQIIGSWFENEYAPRLYGKIRSRELLPDTASNRSDADTKDPSINKVRFLPLETATETDTILFDSTILFVSYNRESPFAVLIRDAEMAKSEIAEFDMLWQYAAT